MSEKKKKTGAPSKYKEEYCQQIVEFFDKEPYEPVQIKVENLDGEMVDSVAVNKAGLPILKPCQLPTLEGFAKSIGVHRETLLNWGKEFTEFFDAIKKAKEIQREILVQNALVGAYDKTFSIFFAKNNTDMNDRGNADFAPVELPPNATSKEMCDHIIRSAAAGQMRIDHAKSYVDIIGASLRIEEVTELAERLKRIEEKLNGIDGEKA